MLYKALLSMAAAAGPVTSVNADELITSETAVNLGEFATFATPGADACPNPSVETLQQYGKYGAVEMCFSIRLRADASLHTDLTNAVWSVFRGLAGGIVGHSLLDGVQLYSPTSDSVRFAIPREKGDYRLCRYWKTGEVNIPPPGRYTDQQFRNRTNTSIDYWWKLRQRGFGKNARIAGMAHAMFVPADQLAKARADNFCPATS